ncbi:transcriptional regulator, LysR family [Rhodopirellula baltica SWK14]|uniref:Transcriptional regulator, LysR family n=2 Tax=Rhodopirellula baltica TaxID=265606 RepID=L7CIP3_RHOBT|nr:transcriptional regulator, LysR family [Rhodopirellula baltica SWK14]
MVFNKRRLATLADRSRNELIEQLVPPRAFEPKVAARRRFDLDWMPTSPPLDPFSACDDSMDIDQLKYFQSVAETKSFTESATRMNLSQPALSRSIQRLEEEFGQPFFERKPRSVELTDAGLLFQRSATQILRILEDTRAEITDDGETGKIRIGAIPTIAPYFLPNLLKQFSNAFPRSQLIVHENTTDELLKRIKQGEIDLAILAEPISEKYVEVKPLMEEELCLLLPPDHPLCDKDRISMKDVEEEPFVMLDEAHCLSENIHSFCRQRSFLPVAVERANQLATVQELVSLSHGISMIPEMARRLDRSKRRVYKSFVSPRPTRRIVCVTNPYRFQSRLFAEFRDRLCDYSKNF